MIWPPAVSVFVQGSQVVLGDWTQDMPRRKQPASCWHLDLFIFCVLLFSGNEWMKNTGKLKHFHRKTNAPSEMQAKNRLTQVSHAGFLRGGNLKLRVSGFFLTSKFLIFFVHVGWSLRCHPTFGPCEVFTLKRLHTTRLNKMGALHVSQEGIEQTALLLLSENKGFPSMKGIIRPAANKPNVQCQNFKYD